MNRLLKCWPRNPVQNDLEHDGYGVGSRMVGE